jgi:hypothetical protein
MSLSHDLPDLLVVGEDMPLCDLIVSDNGFPGRWNLPVILRWQVAADGISPTGASCEQHVLPAAKDILMRNNVVGKPVEIAGPSFTQVLDATELVSQAIDEDMIGRQQGADSLDVMALIRSRNERTISIGCLFSMAEPSTKVSQRL